MQNGKVEIGKIVYQFTDSSVPPEYHRSYQIEIDSALVKTRVTVYGEEIALDSRPITPSKFDLLCKESERVQKSGEYRINMSGTTFSHLTISTLSGEIYKEVKWEGDDGPNKGTLGYVDLIKAQVPNLSDMLAIEYRSESVESEPVE